jgi:two-component system response regulator NreC
MSIRILLADDHKLMREGIRALMAGQLDMSVIAEAVDGRSAVRQAIDLRPDIILMDISMPGLSGIEATRKLLEEKVTSKVIALSMHLDRRMTLEMLEAGASGYLLKDCIFGEVVCAVRSVLSDYLYLSPQVLHLVLKDFVQQVSRDKCSLLDGLTTKGRKVLRLAAEGRNLVEITSLLRMSVKAVSSCIREIILNHIVPYFHDSGADMKVILAAPLTMREREILLWIREGKGTWEISSILGLSQATVKYHLGKAFRKLSVTNRTQAIAVALDNKLIEM